MRPFFFPFSHQFWPPISLPESQMAPGQFPKQLNIQVILSIEGFVALADTINYMHTTAMRGTRD